MSRAIGRMFSYSYATQGGAQGTIKLRQPYGPLPSGFIIQNAFIHVDTALGSAGAATAALTSGESANDIVSATVVAGAPWSSTGNKVTIPLQGTIATWITLTAAREPSLVIATADLNGGAFYLYIMGVES